MNFWKFYIEYNFRYSQFQDEYTLEDIKKSKKVHGFLTMLQCCPTSDGSGACILANEEFVKSHNLEAQAVEIAGMEMATDMESTFKVCTFRDILSNYLITNILIEWRHA